MAITGDKFTQNPLQKTQKIFQVAQIFLRILAFATALTATCLMVTNKQSTVIFGIEIDAKYSYSSAFKFFALANAVACAFCVVSLFLAFFLARQGSINPSTYFLLFLHDLMMMGLVLAACAAATAIGYVGQYGNRHTGWVSICNQFGKFCRRSTISVVLSYLSFISLLLLSVISAYMSRHYHSIPL
ncbi:CASP-like protein 1F1 [Malania oleifera]|uniref:CASP-like protein 1F1 n=1 Tax=Malania oleifera TaxID=397392 RepID=UPI0025AE3271|nr:CASP-like protein 1F1 [Malania oleifera]